MNGDHQSVAAAPLDLSTSNRERGSVVSRAPTPRDTRVTGGSPAHPACTGTDSLEKRCPVVRVAPGSETGANRKRPADKSAFRLPFRKRKIPVEPETQRQSPAPPHSGERPLSADFTGFAAQATNESRFVAAPVTPRRDEEAGQRPHEYPIRFMRPFEYGPYPVYRLPPIPEPHHPLAHQTENLLTGIALATRQDEDGDTYVDIFKMA